MIKCNSHNYWGCHRPEKCWESESNAAIRPGSWERRRGTIYRIVHGKKKKSGGHNDPEGVKKDILSYVTPRVYATGSSS